MKIAHIAPPWIAIPPKNYGGTEIVLYNLVEEQVAHGHDVTLFAPGDARTSARLISFFPHALIDAGVPWQGHLKAYYHLYKAVEYIKDHDFEELTTNFVPEPYFVPLFLRGLSFSAGVLPSWPKHGRTCRGSALRDRFDRQDAGVDGGAQDRADWAGRDGKRTRTARTRASCL